MSFTQRTISLSTDQQKQLAIAAIQNVPTGHNLEVVIREVKKQRTLPQNALMFAGALQDIAEQVWVDGRQFSKEIWHEHFKMEFMPNDDEENEGLIKDPESYVKWTWNPDGRLSCIASTTQLTKKGFSNYLEQIYAFGASHGVLFTAKER